MQLVTRDAKFPMQYCCCANKWQIAPLYSTVGMVILLVIQYLKNRWKLNESKV